MWLTNGTAIQGRGHLAEGTPCQDKIASKSDGATCVIALADGAGSAMLSHFGAELCVDRITQYFLDRFEDCYAAQTDDDIKTEIYEMLMENLRQLSAEKGCTLKDLACTLLCVAQNQNRFITFHLGDGVIAYCEAGTLQVYSAPDNGEFANVTHFVTSDDALRRIRIRRLELPQAEAFYLMSDGAGASLYSPQQHAASRALTMMSDLSLLYAQTEVREEITNFFTESVGAKTPDDCSIVYMVKHSCTIDALCRMPYPEQLDLLGIRRASRHERKRYSRFCAVIRFCETGKKLRAISNYIGLNPKYAKKYVDRLADIGLLKQGDGNVFVNANSAFALPDRF